jgi:hypothetical protein
MAKLNKPTHMTYGSVLDDLGLTGVNLVQLFADFSLQSGRGEEQAEFLIEHALGFRE